MGRNQSNPARKYFSFDVSTNTCTCLIEGCGKLLKGNHAGNLGRHVARWHAEKYQEIMEESNNKRPSSPGIPTQISKRQKSMINPSVNREEVIDACVELVTVNGRPLSLIDDSGFQKILTMLSYNFNSDSIVNEVTKKASYIRDMITKDILGKLISVKVDAATVMNRTFLGINAQFITDDSIVHRTLAIKEFKDRYTIQDFKTVILDVLEMYELGLDQIYTVTTDSGANAIAVNLQSECETDDNDMCSELLDNLVIADESNKDGKLVGVRCAAHTLQLSVEDSLKKESVLSVIQQARTLCKKLRTETVEVVLRKHNLKKPIVGVLSRWQSILDMLESLVKLKDLIVDMNTTTNDLQISGWMKIEEIISALQPVKVAAKQLQEEQMTFGSFFGTWLQCQIDISKVGSYFADSLLSSMKIREKSLFENEAFISSIYLDPRYHVMLSAEHRVRAKLHLMQVWLQLEEVKKKSIGLQKINAVEIKIEPEEEEEDEVEMLLKSREFMGQLTESENIKKEIGPSLDSFVGSPRLNRKVNILDYWSTNKHTNPKLHALSSVVHAVPATQVSVERLCSAFDLILSPLSCNLPDNILEDFLIVRCNEQLLQNRSSECGNSMSSLSVSHLNSLGSIQPETVDPEWGFSWFSSASPGES